MDRAEYEAGIELVEIRMPDHPLLSVASRGYSFINCKYLQKCINDLPKEKTVQITSIVDPSDRRLIALTDKLGHLFTERAKLSNRWHDIADDDNGAWLSHQIDDVQDKIEKTMRHIDHLKITGRLPLDTTDVKFPIPDNDVALIKKCRWASTMRSRKRKEITLLAELNKDTSEQSAKEKYYDEYLQILNQARKQAGI